MKTIVNDNETVIYPMLSENDQEKDDDFCIVIGNNCILINERIVDEDDLPKIITAIERAMDIL